MQEWYKYKCDIMVKLDYILFILIVFFSCTKESEEKKKEDMTGKSSVDTVGTGGAKADTAAEVIAEPIPKHAVYDIKSGIVTYESTLAGKSSLPKNKVVLYFSQYGLRQRIDYHEGLENKILSSDVFLDSARYSIDHQKKIITDVQSSPEMFLFTPIYNNMAYTRKSVLQDTVAGKRCEIYLWELQDIKFTLKRSGWKSICLLHQWTQEEESQIMEAVKVETVEVTKEKFQTPKGYRIRTNMQ